MRNVERSVSKVERDGLQYHLVNVVIRNQHRRQSKRQFRRWREYKQSNKNRRWERVLVKQVLRVEGRKG